MEPFDFIICKCKAEPSVGAPPAGTASAVDLPVHRHLYKHTKVWACTIPHVHTVHLFAPPPSVIYIKHLSLWLLECGVLMIPDQHWGHPALTRPLNIWCGLLDEVGTCVDNGCAARTGGHKHLDTPQMEDVPPGWGKSGIVEVWKGLQWFKFEEIKNQTSSKRTCVHSVPACACAGGEICRES